MYKKGQSPPPRTLPEATEKEKECTQIFAEYEKSVRSVSRCSKMTLNGPQGTISAVTVRSVDMLYCAHIYYIIWSHCFPGFLLMPLTSYATWPLTLNNCTLPAISNIRYYQKRNTAEIFEIQKKRVLNGSRLRKCIITQVKRTPGTLTQNMKFI